MIVDAFTFFNELDILELRLSQLYQDVDLFVLVEAGAAHSGKRKPPIYKNALGRFAKYSDKIIYVGLSELPPITSDTEQARIRLESFQRNAIMLGLYDARVQPDDIVMVSDLDEIPSKSAIRFLKDKATQGVVYTLIQKFYKFYIDEELDDGYNRKYWGGTTACRFATLYGSTPQALRRERGVGGQLADPHTAAQRGSALIYDGGWHLSSFGGERAARVKVAHYIHGAELGAAQTPVEPVPGPSDEIDPSSAAASRFRGALRSYMTERLGGDVPDALLADPVKFRHFFKSFRYGAV